MNDANAVAAVIVAIIAVAVTVVVVVITGVVTALTSSSCYHLRHCCSAPFVYGGGRVIISMRCC